MRSTVSSIVCHAAIPRPIRLSACLLLGVLLMMPLAQARASVPYLGLFIDLDNQFYSAGTSSAALSYQSVGNNWAFFLNTAIMSSCLSQSGASLGGGSTMLIYGQTQAILPIAAASYTTYQDANGSIAVLRAASIPGDVGCIGAVVAPVQFDHVFSDGFDSVP